MKSVFNDLITENEKNQKEIQNFLNKNINIKTNIINNEINNINNFAPQHNDNNFEETFSNFDSQNKKFIVDFIVDSIKYSDFSPIAKNIYEQCNNWKKGIWVVSVGEKNKYKIHLNTDYSLAVNIGPYKVTINYSFQ